jgi:hypothetical protein
VVRVVLLCVRCTVRLEECSRWVNAFSFVEVERRRCFQNAQQTGDELPSYLCVDAWSVTYRRWSFGLSISFCRKIQFPNASAELDD